jgi:hypothetical protein
MRHSNGVTAGARQHAPADAAPELYELDQESSNR